MYFGMQTTEISDKYESENLIGKGICARKWLFIHKHND